MKAQILSSLLLRSKFKLKLRFIVSINVFPFSSLVRLILWRWWGSFVLIFENLICECKSLGFQPFTFFVCAPILGSIIVLRSRNVCFSLSSNICKIFEFSFLNSIGFWCYKQFLIFGSLICIYSESPISSQSNFDYIIYLDIIRWSCRDSFVQEIISRSSLRTNWVSHWLIIFDRWRLTTLSWFRYFCDMSPMNTFNWRISNGERVIHYIWTV